MRIAYYPSFRSLDHNRSSGLVSIARDLHRAMGEEGHEVMVPLHLSMEWIYRRPWRWPTLLYQTIAADRQLRQMPVDCWLTYHSYYRGPDVVGPTLSRRHHLPYFLFASSYASKYRKRVKTWLGYMLNRRALLRADRLFVNKRRDLENLARLVDPTRIVYIPPGIRTQAFPVDGEVRQEMRRRLSLTDKRVVVTAAMMRPGVKEDGIAFVIEACARLRHDFPDIHLLIVGDGPGRERLSVKAAQLLPAAHSFAGRVAPARMVDYYNAGDLFAFPGINESLGMVYLEAQCCGLPVVATSHDGAPEVVADGECGLIVPPFEVEPFATAMARLLADGGLRRQLSGQAIDRVRAQHDMSANYRLLLDHMDRACGEVRR
jgi:glycosyltransferase involved in cell wall biosynthesis